MWTEESLLKQIANSDRTVEGALVRLWARGQFYSEHRKFLSGLAQTIVWRRRAREVGRLPEGAPLLTARQMQYARRYLVCYVGTLVAYANEKAPEKVKVATQREEVDEEYMQMEI